MNIFKTIINTFFFTLCISLSFAQESENEFEPLEIIDTIKSQKVIDQIKSKDEVKTSSFFFTKEYNKKRGLFLIEKKGKYWIVYNYDKFFISNYNIDKHKTHSKRYVSIDISVMRSGSGENYYGWFVLFDLQKKTYLVIQTFSHNSNDDENHEKYINTQKCNSKIVYQNGILIIKRKCSANADNNYCSNCIESGRYKIENNKLIKQ
jgi:hypothetical protein